MKVRKIKRMLKNTLVQSKRIDKQTNEMVITYQKLVTYEYREPLIK